MGAADDEFVARFQPYRTAASREVPRRDGRRPLAAIFDGAVTRAARNAAIVSAFAVGLGHLYNKPSLGQIGGAIVIGSLIGGPLGGIVGHLVRKPTVSWRTEWKR